MRGFEIANLDDLLSEIGKERTIGILADYSCPLNADIEDFLKHKAIDFSKQGLAKTHLVFASYKGQAVLVGYFAIAYKTIFIKHSAKLSSKLRARIRRFATHIPETNGYHISAPLIAQLGKNFTDGYDSLISGDELLEIACDKVKKLMAIGGGMMMLNGIATRADINEGFAMQNITSGIQGIQNGLCDGFHNQTVATLQGFNGVQAGFNELGHQISDCCCTTQRAIDGINFNMAKGLCDLGVAINTQTRDIIDNQNANYRAMMDFMVQEKFAAKDATITQLNQRIALADQTALFGAQLDAMKAEIIRRTGHDYPVASYLVQPPTPVNFPTNGCGQVQFNGNGYGNCGYGCAA